MNQDSRFDPTTVTPEDVPDWGSSAEPEHEPTGLPGNPGFLNPTVPAFAMRDDRGRALVEVPLTPRPAARYRGRLVVVAGTLSAVVAGAVLTLLAGHLLGPGALPGGRSAPAWLVVALVVVALAAAFFLVGVHTVTLSLTGSVRTASALTWTTVLLAVAAGTGAVVVLDVAGVHHPLARGLDPLVAFTLVSVATATLVAGLASVVATVRAARAARSLQDRMRALRRDGVRSPGTLVEARFLGTWSDDGRPQLDATVTYGSPGAERRVALLLVAPQDRVPLVGASVVVLHEPHDDTEPYGTAPAPDADPRDPAGIVLVELDQARPVRFDPDVAAYAKTEPD